MNRDVPASSPPPFPPFASYSPVVNSPRSRLSLPTPIASASTCGQAKEDCIAEIYTRNKPFLHRENINSFLQAARQDFGIDPQVVFTIDELYNRQNMVAVVDCVLALAEVLAADYGMPSIEKIEDKSAYTAVMVAGAVEVCPRC